MKRRNPRITRSTLPAHTIYHPVLHFTHQHPRPRTKGRKPLYQKPSSSPCPVAHCLTRLVSPPALLPRPRSPTRPACACFGHSAALPADHHRRASAHAAELAGGARHRPRDPRCTVSDACGVCGWHGGGVQHAVLCAVSSGCRDTAYVFAFEGGGVGVLSGGQRWVIGASLGRAYADEGRLLLGWLAR
jgi:hypothetical protein